MRKTLSFIILMMVIAFTYIYRENIYQIYNDYFVPLGDKVTPINKNKYYRDYDFSYVKNTNNFIPNNKEDIKNIYYTVVNSGMNKFTFYCPKEYTNCINDVNDLANDQNTISDINNFVHPYNSFKTLKTIHDYIINNTTYDKDRSDKKIINYKSDNAYGALIEGYGLCGGYTDAMMLFLEKFNIPNIKIATENHIWNYVKIDDKWYHLDLTWDDPVSEDDKEILDDAYFLISDNELKNIEQEEHNYKEEIYAQ